MSLYHPSTLRAEAREHAQAALKLVTRMLELLDDVDSSDRDELEYCQGNLQDALGYLEPPRPQLHVVG